MNRLKLYVNRLLGLFPQPLPTGVSAYNTYVAKLMATYVLPTTDADSISFAIASSILRFGDKRAWASPYSFVLTIRSACAKQIAGHAFQDIKQRQNARQLAEQQIISAVATASPKAADAQPT